MAYHDDLLDQALMLVDKEPKKPKQASLRRAVSTAYYALFHLLISACVANWKRPDQRATLGRAFDHRSMKSASERLQNGRPFPFTGEDPRVVSDLRYVANTFVQLQEQRHVADYDNAKFWTKTEALSQVTSVQQAFHDWRRIAKEPIAQAYLISLLVKKKD
ncbi:MAG: hypothetical protein WA324_24475 [Bryobacteraceae bacterium]